MFHGANNFFFENKNYLSSSIGGILSILLLVIFIVLFIVLGEEFFKGTNGKTSTFRQEKLDFNLTISSYLRVPKSQINAYSFKRLSSQETHFLPKLTHCSSSEAKRFYSDIESLKIGEAKNTIDLEQLFKNNSKSYLTLKDYESYDHYCLNIPLNDTFTIVFTSCHPYYNPNFYDPNRIDEYIDSKCTRNNTDLTFNWRFFYGELTEDGDMNEKIIEYTEKNNTKFNIFTYYVSSYMIKEDNGILFENIKTNYFSKLSSPVGTGEYKPIYPYDLGFTFKIDQFNNYRMLNFKNF